jgi:hypothetical protein
MASEESCLPPGCAALGPAAWRRSRLPEPSREMDDRKIFVYNLMQTAFLKANEELNNNVRTPLDDLRTLKAAVLCQGVLLAASESCLPAPECTVPGEGQPEAATRGQAGLRMASEKLCMLPPGHAGGGQPEAAQYQGGLRTASEELCLPSGCAALSPSVWRRSRLPESLKEMGDRKFFIHNMTQTAFLKAKEECNNNVKTPSDELCTPEATILCQAVLMVASESCLPPGRRCAALEEAQYQGGLRMAAEKLCMLPPRYAGGGQPEAIQYQGGLRTASEESCLPPGRAALSPTAGRRSQLPEPSREMDELCIPEAAVLCQAGLMVASESCLPPERAALGEAQYQGGLRMATEKLCMLPPGHAGGGQPEAAQ